MRYSAANKWAWNPRLSRSIPSCEPDKSGYGRTRSTEHFSGAIFRHFYNDVKELDVIQAYEIESVKQTL